MLLNLCEVVLEHRVFLVVLLDACLSLAKLGYELEVLLFDVELAQGLKLGERGDLSHHSVWGVFIQALLSVGQCCTCHHT